MPRLDGQMALITGGTTGIGAASARLFKAEGVTVVATGTNAQKLDAALAGLPGIEIVLSDQADPAASKRLADDVAARHGRIDILLVNAGVAAVSPLDQLLEEDFDRQFDINGRGALFAAKAAVRSFARSLARRRTRPQGHTGRRDQSRSDRRRLSSGRRA